MNTEKLDNAVKQADDADVAEFQDARDNWVGLLKGAFWNFSQQK